MNHFPAKLLLFGEHTVNLGSRALAMPLPLFSGHWAFADEEERENRQMQMPAFAAYLRELQQSGILPSELDLATFQSDLADGLVFESDIPRGYGAGSSGALVAGIFDRYAGGEEWDLPFLKAIFARMEGFFHGTSSGTDPLICYLQQPLLIRKKASVQKVIFPGMQPPYTLFLLDTGIQRKATPLIEYFLKKQEEKGFREACENDLLPAVDEAIDAFMQGNWPRVCRKIHAIGAFQLSFLEKLIPDAYREIWQESLESDYFKLKVCGAGGGGFVLGMTTDFERMKKQYPGNRFLEVPV